MLFSHSLPLYIAAMSDLERFMSRVLKSDSCWLWTGAKTPRGYGTFRAGTNACSNVRFWRAHRFSYLNFVGPIATGLVLDHLCKNTSCVRPDHLECVTQRENLLRGDTIIARYLSRKTCLRGHPFDGTNTGIVNGHRYCKTCNRIKAAYYKKMKRSGRKPGDPFHMAF